MKSKFVVMTLAFKEKITLESFQSRGKIAFFLVALAADRFAISFVNLLQSELMLTLSIC